jgi:Domain of unknown function (DUF222)
MAVEQAVSPDWASLTPGSELAGLLEGVTLSDVPDTQIVPVLAAIWRQISHLHALFWAAMVQVGEREPDPDPPPAAKRADRADQAWQAMGSWHWATHQISAALTFSGRRTDDEYGMARQLVDELPLVWQALSAGQLDPPKAKVFARYLFNLTAEQTELICRRLLPRAAGWTTGQLAHRLLREILAIDPTYARRRYEKAARERGVWGYIAEDGTAVLAGHGLSPTEAAAAAERLEQLAAAVRAAGHPHPEVQLRADLFVRLLDGRYAGFTAEQIIAAMLDDTVPPADDDPGCAAEPGAPGTAEPDAAEPDAAEPDAAEPGVAEPGVAEPGVAEPGAAEPGTVDPSAVDPSAVDPSAVDPSAVDPSAVDPSAVDPSAVDPGAVDPGAVRAASGAAATEPTPADALITGPDTGEPDPVEPVEPSEQPTTAPQRSSAPVLPPAPREGMRAGIEIRVGLSTLLGLDDHPGELPGWGPIGAQESRLLAGRQHAAEWRFAVLDDDGYLIYGGLTRRRPTDTIGLGLRSTDGARACRTSGVVAASWRSIFGPGCSPSWTAALTCRRRGRRWCATSPGSSPTVNAAWRRWMPTPQLGCRTRACAGTYRCVTAHAWRRAADAPPAKPISTTPATTPGVGRRCARTSDPCVCSTT